jgi:hypothetical protein
MLCHAPTTALPETVDLAGITLPPVEYTVAAGFDHTCGWFVPIGDLPATGADLRLEQGRCCHITV